MFLFCVSFSLLSLDSGRRRKVKRRGVAVYFGCCFCCCSSSSSSRPPTETPRLLLLEFPVWCGIAAAAVERHKEREMSFFFFFLLNVSLYLYTSVCEDISATRLLLPTLSTTTPHSAPMNSSPFCLALLFAVVLCLALSPSRSLFFGTYITTLYRSYPHFPFCSSSIYPAGQ